MKYGTIEKDAVIYISFDQALDIVDRIADRATNFGHNMHENEKEAMANLLSDIGVKTSDLIDVSRLADEYAINALIVTSIEVDGYDRSTLEDALFV